MTPFPIKIAGLGHYLPGRIVSNQEIETRCGLPPGWVETRTGVRQRRWVNDETNSFMAAQAATEAIAAAGLTPDDIDLMINASGTQEQAIPDGGPLLQKELGLGESGIPCFTIHATCLSFLVGLNIAGGLLVTRQYRHILITSAEIASCGLNFKQPESAALLGDAAAAAVLTLATNSEPSCFHAFHFETYGHGAPLTVINGGGTRKHPNHPQTLPEDNLFSMEGPRLLKLVHKYGRSFLERLRPGLSEGLGSIKLVVPHQASILGLRLLRHYGWPDEQIMITLDRFGNCVAASLPLTLYQAAQQGRLKRGDEVLLVGSGAGLSMGGLILTF